jgi:hypothetical protein
MTNYRRISLLNFSKVSEVMYNKLSHCVHTNNILVPEKFGVRKGFSTENAGFKPTDILLKAVIRADTGRLEFWKQLLG